MTQAKISGAILGGGAGVRIGGRKAMTLLAGRPLVSHVADVLQPQVRSLVVVGDEEAARALGVSCVADAAGLPRGPMAGVCSAAEYSHALGGEWLLVAPCDTPFLPDDLLARLLAGAGDRDAAYVETAEGRHPLASLWRCSLAVHLRETLMQGHPAVRSVLEAVGAAPVWFDETDAFMNINTPDELLRAEARIAARGR